VYGNGIYLITQDVVCGYDTYDSAVVVAESEEDARTIHPEGGHTASEGSGGHTWCLQKDVEVQRIGVACEGEGRGVICASFNAG